MRRFIRHPSSVPIRVEVLGCDSPKSPAEIKNVGEGGLCFRSTCPLFPGDRVRVEIAVEQDFFEAVGQVAWCEKGRRELGQVECTVGVSFGDEDVEFSVRMVEQVCHIEEYRQEQIALGRELSSEEAAKEWIAAFAAKFPN